MNLIVCDEKCKHQQDGYCTLNHISPLTNALDSTCGYFEQHQPLSPQPVQLASAEYPKSL